MSAISKVNLVFLDLDNIRSCFDWNTYFIQCDGESPDQSGPSFFQDEKLAVEQCSASPLVFEPPRSDVFTGLNRWVFKVVGLDCSSVHGCIHHWFTGLHHTLAENFEAVWTQWQDGRFDFAHFPNQLMQWAFLQQKMRPVTNWKTIP